MKGKAKETLDDAKGKVKEAFDQAKGKAKETASALHNLGQGKSGPIEPNGQGQQELVCSALGKCKHKIASAMGKAKDKASEAAHGMTKKAHEVEEQAKWKVSEAIGKPRTVYPVRLTKSLVEPTRSKEERKAVDTSKTIGKDVAENLMSKIEAAKEKGERKMWKIFRRGGGAHKGCVGPCSFSEICGVHDGCGALAWVCYGLWDVCVGHICIELCIGGGFAKAAVRDGAE